MILLEKGSFYRHFKGKKYLIIDIGKYSETLEEVVIYQQLYGDEEIWVRPLSMFISKVEEGRDDNLAGQTYRFEKVSDQKIKK